MRDGLTNIQQGDYILGKSVRGDLGTWSRWDLYVPTGKRDSIRIASRDDVSPIYKHWREGNYNAFCACCYLGHGHSEEYHRGQIEEADLYKALESVGIHRRLVEKMLRDLEEMGERWVSKRGH